MKLVKKSDLIEIANNGVAWLDYPGGMKLKHAGGFQFLKDADGKLFVASEYHGDWVEL